MYLSTESEDSNGMPEPGMPEPNGGTPRMSHVYSVGNDGRTRPMSRIHCANEDLELQRLLEQNPDLLPGDQINPADPRRWLLVKREMSVPDPGTTARSGETLGASVGCQLRASVD
jgi:hypothetical protein